MITLTDDEVAQLLDLLRQIRSVKTSQLDKLIGTIANKQRQLDR